MKLSSAFEPYLTDFLTDDEPVAEFNRDVCVLLCQMRREGRKMPPKMPPDVR
jgi:hypothetical protein